MKNKKLIIIIVVVICVLMLVLVILQNQLRENKNINTVQVNSVTQNLDNTYQITENTNTQTNNLNENNSEKNVNDNTENNQGTSNPNEVFKNKLLDEDWIRENIYVKKSCFGSTISEDKKQNVYYVKIDGLATPVVLVYSDASASSSIQCFVLTYDNGDIKVTPLEDVGHDGHVSYGVNASQKVVYSKSSYDGEEIDTVYDLNETGATKIYTLKIKPNLETGDSTYYINDRQVLKDEYDNLNSQYMLETIRDKKFTNINLQDINEQFK